MIENEVNHRDDDGTERAKIDSSSAKSRRRNC